MAVSVQAGQAQSIDRATQGFVANLSWLRRRPAVVLLEVAWRWCFGVPALWLLYVQGAKVLGAVPWQPTGILNVTVNQLLTNPLAAATTIANFAALVMPGVYAAAVWVAPLLLLVWAIVSAVGRTMVLKRMDAALHVRMGTMIALQVMRVVPLTVFASAWWLGLRELATWSITGPIAAGGEPQIMLYVGGAIALTLGLFVVAALTGWVFSVAPLLAMLKDVGAAGSLKAALRLGHVRAGLVEINMVMGIVKIALLVLAMVFSACPLPFQSVTTDAFLFWWNVAVGVWWCVASDFFHVARLAGYLHLYQSQGTVRSEA